MKRMKTVVCITAVTAFLLTACAANDGGGLSASGTITARSVSIAPEVSGKIVEVAVNEGDQVEEGDLLFKLDDEILASQYDQAQAAVGVAEAALEAANDQLMSARAQYEIASQAAHASVLDYRQSIWDKSPMDEFEQPVWYFTQSEEIAAARSVLEDAETSLSEKQIELEKTLADASSADFVALEQDLVKAQYELLAADRTLEVAKDAADNEEIEDNAQDRYDLADSNLENAQKEYDQALNTSAADDVLEARAAVAVAQTQVDSAREILDGLLVGDDSLQVGAAASLVEQAQSGVAQAEANLVQAQANLATLEIQVGKTKLYAPIAGVVLLQNLEKGELVSAGSTVMKVGDIDEVTLTVYIPEDKYGLVNLGQDVTVTVDSFPEKTYPGKVTYIADEAEFTPSNVQTVEGRKSTVFAVEITLSNNDHDLKSGMPADVDFIMQ